MTCLKRPEGRKFPWIQTIKWPGDELKEKLRTVKAKYMTPKKTYFREKKENVKRKKKKVQLQRTLENSEGKKWSWGRQDRANNHIQFGSNNNVKNFY